MADVDRPEIDATVAELETFGVQAFGVETDVSSADAIQALADKTIERFGAVHVLVDNASVGGFQRFRNISERSWDWQLGVNLMGPIHGSRIFLPLLMQQEEAHIVNNASVAGFIASPYLAPYSVTKASVVALTESMSQELGKDAPHVGISVLCPAYTATAIDNDQRHAPADVERRTETDPDFDALRETVYNANANGQTPDHVADLMLQRVSATRICTSSASLTGWHASKIVSMRSWARRNSRSSSPASATQTKTTIADRG